MLVAVVALVLLFSVRRDMLPTMAEFTSYDSWDEYPHFAGLSSQSAQPPTPPPGAKCVPYARSSGSVVAKNATANCPSQQYVGRRQNYTVLYNYIRAAQHYNGNESVTYCTHATPDLMHHIGVLCRRWQGPVSVAVYAPGTDFVLAMRTISYLRMCGPPCVKAVVTFHVIFDRKHTFLNQSFSDVPVRNCQMTAMPAVKKLYKQRYFLPYPINIARNVARQMAETYYVLSSDVELYPSRGLVPLFLGMITRPDPAVLNPNPKVFVLPIFEVVRGAPPPSTKAELLRLYKGRHAVFFHKYVCPKCALTPKLVDWLGQRPSPGRMRVFHVAKRHAPFHRWEPVYIGTKDDPAYDERLTWEGRQDKMSQMHALCLLDYDLDIVDNAFLVHAPGIKKRNLTVYFYNRQYVIQNDIVHHQVVRQLNKRYGPSTLCR